MKVNFAAFANALCHRNATPLSVAVLAPCVWGGNVARGVAWQSVVNLATKRHSVAKFNGTANLAWQVWRNGVCGQNKAWRHLQIQHGENGAVFGRGTSLSLSLLALFSTLKFLNSLFLGFCALFVILSFRKKAKNPQRLKENLPFLDTLLSLSMTANASLRAVFAKTAWQSINLALFLLFGLPRSLCSLAMTADFVILSVAKNPKNLRYALFMDTSLTLSMTRFMMQRVFGMTNLGFCLKITDIFTQILGTKFTNFIRFYGLPRLLCSLAMTARHKFKFFTQNSRHFINFTQNSTHFINLSQILSLTQGFFIFLPQIFEQFLLINLVERRSYGSSWHKRQDKNSRAD